MGNISWHGSLTCIYTHDNQGRDVFIAKEVGHLDARLMAASPDMLAALREAARFLDYLANDRTLFVGPGTPKTALAKVQAAITKAVGAERSVATPKSPEVK